MHGNDGALMIERDGLDFERGLHRFHLPIGGQCAVEVGLRQFIVQLQLAHRGRELVRNAQFLILQPGAFAGEISLILPNPAAAE